MSKLECGISETDDILNAINILSDEDTRKSIMHSEEVKAKNEQGKRGFRGNGSDTNIYLPVNLNGKYTVEFLLQCPDPSALNRVIDFRYNSGTGYISVSGNSLAPSSGRGYVDNVLSSTFDNSDLRQVQLQGIDILSERIVVLSGAFDQSPANAFISDLKIYEYYTGDLIHRFMFSEQSNLPVVDEVGNADDGTINNYYSGFSEYTRESYVNTSRWLAWRISTVLKTDCMITLDDGYIEMETIVAPLLQSKSMVANIGIVKDFTESSNPAFMRETSLENLRDTYGFSLVNHTASHDSIALLLESDESAASAQISDCQDWLNARGFNGDYFIYAEANSANSKTRLLAESLGIKLARIPSVTGWQETPPIRALEITPINTNSIHEDTAMQEALNWIDYAVASGGVIVTYNHNVQSDADALAAGYSNTTGVTFYTQLISRLSGVNANTISMPDFYANYANKML